MATDRAQADLVFSNAGPIDSDGASFAGTSTGVGPFSSYTFSGDLTEINTGTFASEARFDVNGIVYQVSGTGGFTGTLNINETREGLFWAPAAGPVTVNTVESFDDGGDGVADSSWANIDFAMNGTAITDLGAFTLGTSFVFDTEGSDFDTEIGGYESNGIFIASDDDGGTGTLSSLNLGALGVGTYYISMGGFNMAYADFIAQTTSTATGNFNVNLNGTSVGSGAQLAGGVQNFRFNVVASVPEPGSFGLMALVGMGLMARRRKS